MTDALELEGSLMGQNGMGVGLPEESSGSGRGGRPLGKDAEVPTTPTFQQLASGRARLASPSPSPGTRDAYQPQVFKARVEEVRKLSGKRRRLKESFVKEDVVVCGEFYPASDSCSHLQAHELIAH